MRRLPPFSIRAKFISATAARFLAAALLLVSCEDETSGPGPNSGDIIFPESNVSYAEHVQPLFNSSCALSGCHDTATKAGDLSLESFREATARPGIIVPREPDVSVLVQSIEGTFQPRMPLNRPPLSENQIKGIRKWILEGANNN